MTAFNVPEVNWEKVNELIPVIIQDNQTGQVLMLGYMNREALKITCETGQVTFYSRTKKRLWKKGETSGHVLHMQQLFIDCDNDSLLILAEIKGPCCHLNQFSCFGDYSALFSTVTSLESVILARYQKRPQNHYTTQLFDQGEKRVTQKVGEEAVEVVLAASCGNKEELISETADLLYHLLVLLVVKQIPFNEINHRLRQRQIS